MILVRFWYTYARESTWLRGKNGPRKSELFVAIVCSIGDVLHVIKRFYHRIIQIEFPHVRRFCKEGYHFQYFVCCKSGILRIQIKDQKNI